MIELITGLQLSTTSAYLVYLVAGVILLHGDARIRWYAFSGLWLFLGSFSRGFFIETALLVLAFILCERYFLMYTATRQNESA